MPPRQSSPRNRSTLPLTTEGYGPPRADRTLHCQESQAGPFDPGCALPAPEGTTAMPCPLIRLPGFHPRRRNARSRPPPPYRAADPDSCSHPAARKHRRFLDVFVGQIADFWGTSNSPDDAKGVVDRFARQPSFATWPGSQNGARSSNKRRLRIGPYTEAKPPPPSRFSRTQIRPSLGKKTMPVRGEIFGGPSGFVGYNDRARPPPLPQDLRISAASCELRNLSGAGKTRSRCQEPNSDRHPRDGSHQGQHARAAGRRSLISPWVDRARAGTTIAVWPRIAVSVS